MKKTHVVSMGVLAGSVLFAVGLLFHVLTPVLVPSIPVEYARNPAVFRPWAGWTRIYMVLHPFGYGIVFAWVFRIVHDAAGQTGRFHGATGGTTFGFLVFLVGSLPVFLLNFASILVPAVILTSWILQSFAQYVAAGALLGYITERVLVPAATAQ
jgi:hypothetical protein